jgi:hypothetical protein
MKHGRNRYRDMMRQRQRMHAAGKNGRWQCYLLRLRHYLRWDLPSGSVGYMLVLFLAEASLQSACNAFVSKHVLVKQLQI